MTATVRNRLILLGSVWGVLLASLPAIVMNSSNRVSGFLVGAVLCAALSGSAGTLAAGRRATARGAGRGVFAGLVTGLFQGLVGGLFAAFLIWALMAVTLSGFTVSNPTAFADLMQARVLLGSFFVALSAFVYTLVCGVLLGPAFGTLINRTAGKA